MNKRSPAKLLRRLCIAFPVATGFFLMSLAPVIYSSETLRTPQALASLISILRADFLAELFENLTKANPKASQDFLLVIHKEAKPKTFARTVRLMSTHPLLFKRFLHAATASLDVPAFSKIIDDLTEEPEAIRTVTYQSLLKIDDADIIRSVQSATRHPYALKLFALELDDKIITEFTKKNLEDRAAFAILVEVLQKDGEKIRDLAPGVDLFAISGKIVKELDQNYFKELLSPQDGNSDFLFLGLSLTDGMIDLPGKEEIDLAGVNRQSLKMIDSPAFLFSFIWNIYFGDRSSQVALHYRKALFEADAADGAKDGKVSLRKLAQDHPETFAKLNQSLMDMLAVTRFRDKLSDPAILLDPLIDFMSKHDARTVADTFAPLFMRSIELRPHISKVVTRELPPEIIGALLQHVVDYMATTQHGRETLKKLMLAIWKDIPATEIQKVTRLINEKDPAALHEMVLPVMLALSPKALAQITQLFTNYENIFYRFNGTAIRELKAQSMIPITAAVIKDREDFYRLADEWTKKIPEIEQNALLYQLSQNEQTLLLLDQLVSSLDQDFLDHINKRFVANPRESAEVSHGFPKNLVTQVYSSYQKRVHSP